jgi:putative membrane protein
MAFLTKKEKEHIEEAVRRVEINTRGELVTVIARRSDDYTLVPWIWSTLIAMMLPGLLELVDARAPLASAYISQVSLFVVLLFLLRWQPLKMWLVPKAMKHASARRLAREQFFIQKLHMTRERTGMLIFVSVAEHYVEILADEGIDKSVPTGTWDGMVKRFVGQVKTGNTAAGFIEIVEECGNYLAKHFPARPDDTNELPNVLIEI